MLHLTYVYISYNRKTVLIPKQKGKAIYVASKNLTRIYYLSFQNLKFKSFQKDS